MTTYKSFDEIVEITDGYPGRACQIWSGWVWVTGYERHHWTKRKTYEECIRAVYECVQEMGIDQTFNLCDDEDAEVTA